MKYDLLAEAKKARLAYQKKVLKHELALWQKTRRDTKSSEGFANATVHIVLIETILKQFNQGGADNNKQLD